MSNLAGVVRLLFRVCASAILFRAAADMVALPSVEQGYDGFSTILYHRGTNSV